MSLINRITTWAAGQVLKAADLNGEFNNIINLINNLDSATTSWDNVSSAAYKYSGNTAILLLQSVQSTTSTAFTTTSSTFTGVTNHSVTITPKSTSSRIRLTFMFWAANTNAATNMCMTIKRGSTDLSGGVARGFGSISTVAVGAIQTLSYLDSPASVSALTYQLYILSDNNTNTVQVGRADTLSVLIADELSS